MRSRDSIKPYLYLALVLLIFALSPLGASANDIVVDKRCSLAKAIGSANNDSSKDRCETGYREDSIFLEDNLELEDELPVITSRIVLEGNNHSITVKPRYPAFTIKNGSLTIKNLKVKFSGKNRAGPTVEIDNGSLTIIDSQFKRCTGKFLVEDSVGAVQGASDVCGYAAGTVANWFGGAPPLATAIPAPAQPDTCQAIAGGTATISARYGLGSGLQCQQVDAAGIGDASLVAAGFIDAVDVWGYVEQGVEICFAQPGAIVFLDAAYAPRRPSPLPFYAQDGKTCATLNRPGTVVLAPGQAPDTAAAEAPDTNAAQAPDTVAAEASQCNVTTLGNLNLRASPGLGENIIGLVPRGTSLPALARTLYWFQVKHRGATGWISANARYVAASGNCDSLP